MAKEKEKKVSDSLPDDPAKSEAPSKGGDDLSSIKKAAQEQKEQVEEPKKKRKYRKRKPEPPTPAPPATVNMVSMITSTVAAVAGDDKWLIKDPKELQVKADITHAFVMEIAPYVAEHSVKVAFGLMIVDYLTKRIDFSKLIPKPAPPEEKKEGHDAH